MSNCGMCQGLSFGKKKWFEKSREFLERKSKKFPSLTRLKRRHNKSPLRSSPLRSLKKSPFRSPLKTKRLSRMSRMSRHFPMKKLSKHFPSRHSLRIPKFKRRRSFGSEMGPGYIGQTSYPNAYAPYFGSSVPYVNAPNWWYPVTDGIAQSPGMLSLKP